MVTKILLQAVAVILILIGAGAFAQTKDVPSSRQQIMLSYAPLVKKVAPAVVNIYTKRLVTKSYSPFASDPFFEQFFGRSLGGLSRQQLESSLGSGVIVDGSGIVITNAHVIKGAEEISVVLTDGRQFDARLSLSDEPSDIAILRVDTKGDVLPHVPLSASESLEVGDIVLAIGNPFGVGQTVTSGIVSALARSSLDINDFNFFIQTDAAINPGNSGGPLVSMDGTIVGINTAIYSKDGGSLGIGFAVPSEMVATVLAAEKGGQSGSKGVTRPWLGVSGQAVTNDIADSLGLTRPSGVLISDLHPVSPAKKAGLMTGDVVIAVNGKPVRDQAEMKFRLATVPIGQSAKIDFIRKGSEQSITITAMAPPDIPAREETTLEGAHPLNGAKVANINPAVAVELGLSSDFGKVVVMSIDGYSAAARVVRAGDIILSINEDRIEDVKDLKRELEQGFKRGGWVFMIERAGQSFQVVVR